MERKPNPHHALTLGEHSLEVLRHVAQLTDDPDVRLAALLHDIGKPESAWLDPVTGYNHYYQNEAGEGRNHDEHGAMLADQRLKALRYPTNRTERVRQLINHHMYPDFSSSKGARKFLRQVGDHADDLLTLREADRAGKGTPEHQATKTPVEVQRNLVQEVRTAHQPTRLSELAIGGDDLIGIGYRPGPQLGATLNYLLDQVEADPSLNECDKLLQLVLDGQS